ncbi:type II secretion system F family protein [Pollutimonas harenae]|uniref:Type II secretion system F family protein n=1 Tax=Pollutimonas harenae TaxID=657015 RepID=A0A853GYP9_9BURK|nr:type II secretion system F family protein [Pollutimonas harenae]NYT85856.1 type II secretion system F family protein [Pollutimonas harenae]TEA70913.1 pilus assembly protein [Pollutimonas harenae]
MTIFFFLLSTTILFGVCCWFLQKWLSKAYVRYQRAFQRQTSERLDEFFLFVDPAQLWMANLSLCTVLIAVVYGLTGGVAWAVLSGVISLLLPQYGIGRLRKRRVRRFDEQLPDLLQALAGALRAGAGLQSALRHIVAQSPAPLSQEFGLILRQQRMGVGFEQALADLYRRMPFEGTGLVVSALTIAAQSGGNLAETLEGIAATLRARLRLLDRVQALTSQGRLQAWIMAGLPPILAIVLHYLDPDAMQALWKTPAGWSVLATVVVMEVVGIWFIRRIVAIQV